jgi:hypothetical protein
MSSQWKLSPSWLAAVSAASACAAGLWLGAGWWRPAEPQGAADASWPPAAAVPGSYRPLRREELADVGEIRAQVGLRPLAGTILETAPANPAEGESPSGRSVSEPADDGFMKALRQVAGPPPERSEQECEAAYQASLAGPPPLDPYVAALEGAADALAERAAAFAAQGDDSGALVRRLRALETRLREEADAPLPEPPKPAPLGSSP